MRKPLSSAMTIPIPAVLFSHPLPLTSYLSPLTTSPLLWRGQGEVFHSPPLEGSGGGIPSPLLWRGQGEVSPLIPSYSNSVGSINPAVDLAACITLMSDVDMAKGSGKGALCPL